MTKGDTLKSMLDQFVKETGATAEKSTADIATYTVQRSAHLTSGVNQPGFEEAVRAEYNNVKLFSGISVTHNADAADARFFGLITGAMAMLA